MEPESSLILIGPKLNEIRIVSPNNGWPMFGGARRVVFCSISIFWVGTIAADQFFVSYSYMPIRTNEYLAHAYANSQSPRSMIVPLIEFRIFLDLSFWSRLDRKIRTQKERVTQTF